MSKICANLVDGIVLLDGKGYRDEHLPIVKTGVRFVWWKDSSGHLQMEDGPNIPLTTGEEYKRYVYPYQERWKKHYEEEQEELRKEEERLNSLPYKKEVKLQELKSETGKLLNSSLLTSYEFPVNNDKDAITNLEALISTLSEQQTVEFCDYNNEFHTLTKSDLRQILTEIREYRLKVMNRKFQLKEQIQAALTVEELDGIRISFE